MAARIGEKWEIGYAGNGGPVCEDFERAELKGTYKGIECTEYSPGEDGPVTRTVR